MRAGTPKTSPPTRRSALRSGILTGLSTLILSGSGAVAAAYLAQKFGRTAATDGFLAAYGVYVVLTLAAQALRLTVVPELTRAGAEGRLGEETGSYAGALLVVGIPASLLAAVLAEPLGRALTGGLPERAAELATDALPWLVAAAFAQLLAALAASALATHDRFGATAAGFSLGGIAGLALFVALADSHGIAALAWGIALSGAIALVIPLAALVLAGELRGIRVHGLGHRLWMLAEGAAVPVALQGLYLISLRLATALGVGAVTSLSYAYFFAAILVAATATSLSVISTAPLTRRGLEAEAAAEHIVHGSWLSLPLIAAAAGVFALEGDRIAASVLGEDFSGDVGTELSRLVVVLAPWTVAAVGFSLSFPLIYVLERGRVLVPIALAAPLVHLPLSLVLRAAWDEKGLALALGISTFGVLGALLVALSPRALALAAVGLGRVAAVVGGLAALAFGGCSLVLSDAPAAVSGLVVYVILLGLLRPRGLRESWSYVRALH
jgi:hypothetical protein